MRLTPEVDFSNRDRINAIKDRLTKIIGLGVDRDGTDFYYESRSGENQTVATMMTDLGTGEIVLVYPFSFPAE